MNQPSQHTQNLNHRVAGQASVAPFSSVVFAVRLDSTTNSHLKNLQDAIEQSGYRRPSCSQIMRVALRQLSERQKSSQDFVPLMSQINQLSTYR